MNLLVDDNTIKDPIAYVDEIWEGKFYDIPDGDKVFKNIQPRSNNDEFSSVILGIFPDYKIKWNFVRMSPLNQEEPNFIHKDDMMGDITCILYLNEQHPDDDGTTFYDNDGNVLSKVYSKFNRMVCFDSDTPHSRSIFENFGEGKTSRLIQVIFLSEQL